MVHELSTMYMCPESCPCPRHLVVRKESSLRVESGCRFAKKGPARESRAMASKARRKSKSIAQRMQPARLVAQVIAEFAVGALQRLKTKLVSCPSGSAGGAGFTKSGAGFAIEV